MTLKPPTSLEAPALADWLEFNVLFGDGDGVSVADLRRMLEPLNVESRKGRGRTSVEALMGSIRRQVDLRSRLAGASYPLAVGEASYDANGDWNDFVPYVFLLLCSLTHHYPELSLKKAASKRPAELFGFLGAEALATYLMGSAFRFDSPRHHPVPVGFADALAYMEAQVKEPRWSESFAASSQKDDGLDVLAWKSFGDARGGQVVIVAQCAVGKDWKAKLTELDTKTWAKHMRWHVDPIRALLVPFNLDGDRKTWERMCTKAGIVLDRLRVASFASRAPLPEPLRTDLRAWCVEMAKKAGALT